MDHTYPSRISIHEMEFQVALDIINNVSDDCLHLYANRTITVLRRLSERLQHNFLPTTSHIHVSPGYAPGVPSPPSPPKSPQGYEEPGTLCQRISTGENLDILSSAQSHQSFHLPVSFSGSPELESPETSDHVPRSPQIQIQQASTKGSARRGVPWSMRKTPDNVPGMINRVKRSCAWIEKLTLEKTREIFCDDNFHRDLRWDHIRRVTGDRSIGIEAKIMRILALRSIALQFTDEQIGAQMLPTKLEQVYNHARLLKDGRTAVFQYDKKNFSSIVLALGLKHLTLERFFAELNQNTPESYAGISVLTGLHIDAFRRLRYNEMSEFVRKLAKEDVPVPSVGESVNFLVYMQKVTVWFNQLQEQYDLIYRTQMLHPTLTTQPTDSDIPPPTPDNEGNFQGEEYTRREDNIQENQSRASDFADLFEQIQTQPYDISQIMDDVINRSCFDFDEISPEPFSDLNM